MLSSHICFYSPYNLSNLPYSQSQFRRSTHEGEHDEVPPITGLSARDGDAALGSERKGPGQTMSDVVQELVASEKLKSLIAWRRRLRQGAKRKQQTPTELVLTFAQSNTHVRDLEAIVDLVTRRARMRATGFKLMAATIATGPMPRAPLIANATSVTRNIRSQTGQGQGSTHFLGDLDGCPMDEYSDVIAAQRELVVCLVDVLRDAVPLVCAADKRLAEATSPDVMDVDAVSHNLPHHSTHPPFCPPTLFPRAPPVHRISHRPASVLPPLLSPPPYT